MVQPGIKSGEIAMALLGEDIPAIGPKMKTKNDALLEVRKYVSAIEGMVKCSNRPFSIMFSRQTDGRFMMVIKSPGKTLELLHNFDELTMKRFQRSFRKKLFIITSFFEEGESLECTALTDGLGAVMYVPW
ncbi:MAG: hypothetical protein ACYDEQ_13450 [Desulfocucumaceae bacterium]